MRYPSQLVAAATAALAAGTAPGPAGHAPASAPAPTPQPRSPRPPEPGIASLFLRDIPERHAPAALLVPAGRTRWCRHPASHVYPRDASRVQSAARGLGADSARNFSDRWQQMCRPATRRNDEGQDMAQVIGVRTDEHQHCGHGRPV